jgi:hypothetical protein
MEFIGTEETGDGGDVGGVEEAGGLRLCGSAPARSLNRAGLSIVAQPARPVGFLWGT